jgi:GAF domain-containing protein
VSSTRPASTPSVAEGPAVRDAASENRILYRVIQTVASTLELTAVLDAIVELLSEAACCHACFAYLDDGDGGLTLRAASSQYADLVGKVRFAPGEGVVGWVHQRRREVFIREDALSDPRMRYVPELEEERFQSFVAVPLLGRDGRSMGAISLHTEAPREFSEEESNLLVHAASLTAGAIENARLYETTRRRIGVLEALSQLGATISRCETVEELLPAVVARLGGLVEAEVCQAYLLEPAEGRLRLRASVPPSADSPFLVTLPAGGSRRERAEPAAALAAALFGAAAADSTVVSPLVATGELLGFLTARVAAGRTLSGEDRELVAAIASQTAVAIKKIQLIERLTEKNLIKDFFEDLGRGVGASLAARGRRLGLDLERPHVVVLARPAADAGEATDDLAALEAALPRILPRAVCDSRDGSLRALVPVPATGEREIIVKLEALRPRVAPHLVIGLSSPCSGAAAYATGFEEARQAAQAAPVVQEPPGVVSFDDLGPYKYLLRVSQEGRVRDRHADALRRLLDYDRARHAQLVRTLEEYLRQRGNVAATAQALFVHPNTLRQRLRRIAELTQLDVRTDDWLMIEIALKLLRLEAALDAR